MTDEQVKKGLECCGDEVNTPCKKCPYYDDCYPNQTLSLKTPKVFKDALALIKRLEEEKEQIRKETVKEVLLDLKGLLEGYVDKHSKETLFAQKCRLYDIEVEK